MRFLHNNRSFNPPGITRGELVVSYSKLAEISRISRGLHWWVRFNVNNIYLFITLDVNFKISMKNRLGSRSKAKVTGYGQSQIPGTKWSIFRARFAECSKEPLE